MTLKERQQALEKEMLDLGLARAQEQDANGHAPLTPAIKALLGAVSNQVRDTMSKRTTSPVRDALRHANDPEGIAWTTLQTAVGQVLGRSSVLPAKSTVAEAIGQRVGDIVASKGKGLSITRATACGLGEHLEATLLKKDAGQLFEQIARIAERKTTQLRATPALEDLVRQKPEQFMRPHFLPCVLPPAPWAIKAGRIVGGYHSLEMRKRVDFINVQAWDRGTTQEYLSMLASAKPGTMFRGVALFAVDALQATPWKVNRRVYEAMKPVTPVLVPAMRYGRKIQESNPAYRTLEVAERFIDGVSIYFVHRLQVSGRIDAMGADLNPQGSDAAKGLLTFAEGKPLGTQDAVDALAVHGANVYGKKGTLAERIVWVKEHEAEILEWARTCTPSGDEPWQFLAFCFEWEGYKREGLSFVSSLPVMADGTCNGLQHFSAMLRDEEGGLATNLCQSEERHDLYEAVAEKAGLERKQVKGCVLAYPYGMTTSGRWEELAEAGFAEVLRQKRDGETILHCVSAEDRETLIATEKRVIGAITQVVTKAPRIMEWLQGVARAVTTAGRPVFWATPAGFLAWYARVEEDSFRVPPDRSLSFTLPVRDDQGAAIPDVRGTELALPAVFVHSLDASHLMLTMSTAWRKGITSLTAIHDCYGTVAADAPMLGKILREMFVTMYQEHDPLGAFRQQLMLRWPDLEIPKPEEKGALDIRGVLQSKYFFS